MSYAELLKSYIRSSRLTLQEISESLNKRNLSASTQYLSKLQNGKVPPASKELNRALAEITGGDAEQLVITAYIEKAPSEVKKLIHEINDIDVDNLSDKHPIIKELKKYPSLYYDLSNNPKKRIKALAKVWDAIKETTEEYRS